MTSRIVDAKAVGKVSAIRRKATRSANKAMSRPHAARCLRIKSTPAAPHVIIDQTAKLAGSGALPPYTWSWKSGLLTHKTSGYEFPAVRPASHAVAIETSKSVDAVTLRRFDEKRVEGELMAVWTTPTPSYTSFQIAI